MYNKIGHLILVFLLIKKRTQQGGNRGFILPKAKDQLLPLHGVRVVRYIDGSRVPVTVEREPDLS